MSKDFLNTRNISEKNVGIPRKQKFVTNPTPSAVTRYVCISKDAHGSAHSQPLAFWESVRNNDPVVTQHVCCFEESGSDVSSSIASTNVVLKKHIAVIPADAVPAFTGFCSVGSLSQKRHRQPEHVTEKQHPGAHIRSCREQQKSTRITPHTWREQIQIIKKEDAIAAGGGVVDPVTVSTVDSKGTNDREICSKSVKYKPESLSTDGNKARPEHLDIGIKEKSDGSTCRTSTQVQELNSANSETKSAQDTTKRKSFHNRNKTREYILQQKQKRKERFATEQSKKIMEDEMKKIKLQTLREKSLKIVKTNVKKSLSKKRSTEKLNNLESGTTSNRNDKVDDLQAPAVTVNKKSVSHKSVTVTKYKVAESVPSQVPLAAKCDDNTDVAQSALVCDSNEGNSNKSSSVDLEVKDNQQKKNVPLKSSLSDSSGGNSNKSNSVDLKLKDNQQMRNELDLKIRAVAKALSAELESSILCSSYDPSDKVTEDGFNLSLQRPLLRLRDTVCSRQTVGHSMENRVANIDSGTINISDSPPTKLKRYDHTEQMKSLEKKMELANHTISMLRENNIIKSVEESNRGQTGIFKRREKVQKENSVELEKKSRQKTVESPQQYFSKRSAFPFHPGQHSETTENARKLLKNRRNASKTNNIQNHSITSTQMVFSHIPQMSMEHSSGTSANISESSNIEKRENVQSKPSKHLDEVMNLNYLPSSFTHNLQTIESNICVTPVGQKTNPKLRRECIKSRQTTDDDCYKRSDKKSQLRPNVVTTNDLDLLKDCEFKVQPNEKLKKLLQEHANEIDRYAVNPPLTHDVATKSPGAAAELFKRAVEREKRERAATRIQALYRGHSTRKSTAALLIGTRSNGNVQRAKLQKEECHDHTKRETGDTEDLSGSKFNTGEPTDWLQLEPVKPCPYNVMTAVRQKLLALKKVSDAKIETKATNICTDQTFADDESAIKDNMSTQHQNKEVCTSGSWVDENAMVQKNTIASVAEKRRKVQTVKLRSAKEYSSNVEERSDNRKMNDSNKSYVFSEEAGWIENKEPEQKRIGTLCLSTINKSNITQRSRNQGKTCESSVIPSVIGSDIEHLHKCNLKNNNEDLALPDVHLVRKRRRSENGTVSIRSNFEESCSSGAKQTESSLPTSKADWIEASVHSASAQSSFPTESETHNKASIAESKSEHFARNSKYLKTKSSINISDRDQAEKSSTQCTELPHETETKRTVTACSGSSANGSHNRHKVHTLLESGKMMPPEALHLQFQAEINLLESLEKSRLQLAQIEGLHALSLIQHHKHLKAVGQKDEPEQKVMSDHQQHPATTHDKIDGFDENRRKFNAVVESMRKGAALSGAEPEDIDWLTFSDVSNSVKPPNTQATCEKKENELFQTDKGVLKNCEMNFYGENQEKQNAKYSYDSSFTSVTEDISGHKSSTKSKPSELNSVSDSIIKKTLDTALKKGQISIEAYCKYEKLIQEEATRSRDQAILLDATERALIERFKIDMKTLQTNKRQLKQCGKENLISSIKKKKRALVLKLEHDREEIKRLRKTYMEASKEWKNLLFQHLTLTKCNMTDNEILGKEQQEKLPTSTTSISTELEVPVNSDTKKSSVPSTSSLQTEVSSSIQTKLSQHSAQSKRSAGSDSWSSNKKTENSRRVKNTVNISTDLTKTDTAAETFSSEKRHSLLPSKRLWSHDEISDWQHSTGEDNRRVRPFIYHRDHSISPMRVLQTEKQHTNLNRSADPLPVESSSVSTCFDRDSVCGKNSSGIAVPVIESSNNKNSSTSQKAAATISSVEELCKHSNISIRMPISPIGMKRHSSGSDESIMFSQGDTPSEQSDLEGRVCALREQLRRREQEAEKLKQLQRRKARREELKATEQSLVKQIQVLDSYITRTKEQLKQNVNTSPLHAVKPKIKQPHVRTEKSSKHILVKTKEKPQPHEQTEQNSNRVLDKEKYTSPPDDTSQNSVSNGISTEIPTVIVSEHTANSVTFLPDDTSSITFREATTSEDDNLQDEIVSVLGSYERRSEALDSTQGYVSNEINSYSKDTNATIKTSSIKSVCSLSSDQQSSVHVKHSNPSQVLDSYVIQTKDELMQGFNSSPVLAVKSNIKDPGVLTEQSTKSIVDKQKEKSEPHEQTEENCNLVLDKAQYESPPDHTSQKSISNSITSEIETISSEQAANSNSRTSREAHSSEDDKHQDNIVSVSGSFERRKEALDYTVDYVSNGENTCSKNKDDNIKTSSVKEISSVSSQVRSTVGVKHTESEPSFITRGCSGAESIIPATLASGDHFFEEDREISEVLIDSTFVVNNTEYSSTEQCNDPKNENAQESCVSSSLKPLDNLYEDKSNDLFSKRSDSLVKNVITQETDSKTLCTSTTINEELSEIEETSMSVQHISDFTEVQKTLSVDSAQHEIMGKTDSDLVPAPQNVSDAECVLTSSIDIKNVSPDTLTAGREEIMDKKQVVLSSTENQSEALQRDTSEESALNNYSNNIDGGGDVTEFCHSSDDSICTESHPVPVQLNATFVVEEQEHTTQDQIVVDSKENENKMEKLKLVDSITESIMLQLLKDSLVLPNSRQKEYGQVPNVNAPRKTVLSEAHKFSKIAKPNLGLAREIEPNSRTMILDEPDKQEILTAELKPKPVADISINNNTFLLDESTKSEKNTSELVDEMLNHCLKNATSDVLNIYNKKISNSDRLCVPSEASKECPQTQSIEISGSGNDSDLRLPDHDSVCKSSEITNVTLKKNNNNIHFSVDDSFHNVKKINDVENGLQDMISFTSPDGKRVQELELSVGDLLKPVSEHSTCEKFMGRTDIEQSQETERGVVSSGCLTTGEGDSHLHHGHITAAEVVMSEGPLPDGCKSKVATQNGNQLKDISHLQKVEARCKQTVNNETFPPGWFEEDLDLSNSWREAEQLRLQQLHIEQEIRRLEEQQHQQQALVLVREIPDKPPPPYTPRGTTLHSSSPLYPAPAIGASAPRHRLVELVTEAIPLLTSSGAPPMLPPEDFCTGYNTSIRRFIYDLGRSLVNEAVSVPGTDDEYGEEASPQQITVKRSQEAVRAHVTRRATALLDGSAGAGPNSAGKLRRLAVGPRWRRRDHVDELLVREARDEEPGWIDYRRDEAHLCNETACALLCDLLDDTVTAITTAITRRMAAKTTGVV